MNNFSFIKNTKVFFGISLAIIILGVISFIALGFNVDVDFAGGTEITLEFENNITSEIRANVETIVTDLVGDKFSSVKASGSDGIIIRTKEMTTEERDSVIDAVVEAYELDKNTALVNNENVSASISNDLKEAAVLSTVIAVILMLAYITLRFRFSFAIASVLCLIHDVFVVVVSYSVLSIPVNSNIIAVLLTILGYSINATIIIFDRVRENGKLHGSSLSYADRIDLSIRQTLKRSLYTTLTTLFTITMIYILGVPSIKDFALPLIVGIVAGLYSSVCLAGPLAYAFGKKKIH